VDISGCLSLLLSILAALVCRGILSLTDVGELGEKGRSGSIGPTTTGGENYIAEPYPYCLGKGKPYLPLFLFGAMLTPRQRPWSSRRGYLINLLISQMEPIE
jgi:hypothetical protein